MTGRDARGENRKMRRSLLWILIFSFVFLSFSHDAEARRRRRVRRHHHKRLAIINEKKLYERLGGGKAISEIVDEWMRLNLADNRIAPAFSRMTAQPERLGRLRRNLGDQLCEIADGPCTYKGPETRRGHAGLVFGDDQFLIFSDNLVHSLQKKNVAEREKNELLARFGEIKPDIVSDSSAPSGRQSSN